MAQWCRPATGYSHYGCLEVYVGIHASSTYHHQYILQDKWQLGRCNVRWTSTVAKMVYRGVRVDCAPCFCYAFPTPLTCEIRLLLVKSGATAAWSVQYTHYQQASLSFFQVYPNTPTLSKMVNICICVCRKRGVHAHMHTHTCVRACVHSCASTCVKVHDPYNAMDAIGTFKPGCGINPVTHQSSQEEDGQAWGQPIGGWQLQVAASNSH